jgi:hypothetical protein
VGSVSFSGELNVPTYARSAGAVGLRRVPTRTPANGDVAVNAVVVFRNERRETRLRLT